MRYLREKHDISIAELSRYCDISPQRLSQIELGEGNVTVHMCMLVETAFGRLIAERRKKLAELEKDYNSQQLYLLDLIEEGEPK